MMTDEAFLDDVWKRKIEPRLAARSMPVSEPVTVFLGGQPAAGKTRAQRELVRGYSGGLLSIVGDDFRQFHPDYERLCEEDPLAMPDVTAPAAGYWTGKAVGYADAHGVSCIIEGTEHRARRGRQGEAAEAEDPCGGTGRSAHAEPIGTAGPFL